MGVLSESIFSIHEYLECCSIFCLLLNVGDFHSKAATIFLPNYKSEKVTRVLKWRNVLGRKFSFFSLILLISWEVAVVRYSSNCENYFGYKIDGFHDGLTKKNYVESCNMSYSWIPYKI